MSLTLVLTGLAVFVTHGLEAITGFGCTVLALPFVTLLLGIGEAKFLLAILAWALALYMAISKRKRIVWKQYGIILLFVGLGLPIGMYAFATLPKALLVKLLGVFIIISASLQLWRLFVTPLLAARAGGAGSPAPTAAPVVAAPTPTATPSATAPPHTRRACRPRPAPNFLVSLRPAFHRRHCPRRLRLGRPPGRPLRLASSARKGQFQGYTHPALGDPQYGPHHRLRRRGHVHARALGPPRLDGALSHWWNRRRRTRPQPDAGRDFRQDSLRDPFSDRHFHDNSLAIEQAPPDFGSFGPASRFIIVID